MRESKERKEKEKPTIPRGVIEEIVAAATVVNEDHHGDGQPSESIQRPDNYIDVRYCFKQELLQVRSIVCP